MHRLTRYPALLTPSRFSRGRTALRALLVVSIVGCGGADGPAGPVDGPAGPGIPGNPSGPRTSVPEYLQGGWTTGTVSQTDLVNMSNGSWTNSDGVGIYFHFTAEGGYQKAVRLYQSDGYCSRAFMGYVTGTVEVDEDQLVLHPESGRIKSVDSCVQDYNYERPDEGLEDETLFWEIGDEGYGNTVLVLSTNGNGGSVFHPEE